MIFGNQTADLIHISRTLPPKLKAAFSDKPEHFPEYEFGYYADLPSVNSVSDFKIKFLLLFRALAFQLFHL
jgi:hypothetical protein